jgi:hypothetical protein
MVFGADIENMLFNVGIDVKRPFCALTELNVAVHWVIVCPQGD